MLASRFLIYNKKRTLNTILSITLITTLLLTISLIFSSFHKYLVQTELKENNYHVFIEGHDFKKPTYVKSKIVQNKIIYLKYKNVYKTKQYTKDICKKIKCHNITYNEKLLSLYGLSKNSTLNLIKKLLIIILIILGTTSFIIIKNTFHLTLVERKKELGILKSIGMSKTKILKTLIEEGSITFIIGLIIGIALSLWLTTILIFIINNLLKGVLDTKIILTFYLPFIVISSIFIIIIFYSSIIIPAYKICKLNIISLLKENTIFKNKKIPKIIYHLSPIKRLAFSNYYRLKKNYRPIKHCILITSILYIAFSLYLSYSINSLNKYITLPKYDFFISTVGTEDNYKKLKKFSKKYQKYKIYSTCQIQGNIDKTSYLNKNYNQTKIIIIKNKKEGIINYITIDKENNKVTNKKQKYLKNKIILNINNSIQLTTINKIPFGLDELLTKDNIVFLTNNFNKYCPNYFLNAYIKDKKEISKHISKLKIKDEITYTDIKKATKLTKNFVKTLKLSLYGILILVILISITLINTSFSLTVYQRKKELGILKSIGSTNLNLKKLLLIESLIIIFKTFILIIPISYLISYILYQNINQTIITKIIIPNKELAYSFIVIFIIIYYSLTSNFNKIIRKPITEITREETL